MSRSILNEKLYVSPFSKVRQQAIAWKKSFPEKALLMDKIAQYPQAIWLTDKKSPNKLDKLLAVIKKKKLLGIFVLYFIPDRDLGGHSSGGAKNDTEYKKWIDQITRIIENTKMIVILEPDALSHIKNLRDKKSKNRIALLKYAISKLTTNKNCIIYVDAGHPRWHSVKEIARRLRAVGVSKADGFSLNVSNFVTTKENISYGEKISKLINNKHFVIDTSRNGAGPKLRKDQSVEWCNPKGRVLGMPPTTNTNHSLVDAFLWIKRPGESDGECNGGPKAGVFWAEYALGLAKRAEW